LGKEFKNMTSQKICPTCKGKKIIVGNCECNAEWRSMDSEDGFDDCQCEPDVECPECQGKGYKKD
jgi:hypothetical protein